MDFFPTQVDGAVKIEFPRYGDTRGFFQEALKLSKLSEHLGETPLFKQVNQSKSAAGVVRGIHWADYPPGQSKYLTVQCGSIVDFVIDLREGSETFGSYDLIHLGAQVPSAIFIGNGIGHAFLALEDDTVITYLCTEEYNPLNEFGITPLDRTVALPLEELRKQYGLPSLTFSEKDLKAPTLDQQLKVGRVPVLF